MRQLNRQICKLSDDAAARAGAVIEAWRIDGNVTRLWNKDASLWTNTDESRWLSWLSIVDEQLRDPGHLRALAEEIRAGGFAHALLLGMGGSSLCPEVLAMTFGPQPGFPEMRVLDSTVPAQVLAAEKRIDVAKTVFIVASKSGSTLEPAIFKQHFFERVAEITGRANAGRQFIAITDPGSLLESEAKADGFRRILYGVPEIGGRFSALSNFGMAPAAVMGLDTVKFLESARLMVEACGAETDPAENPGVVLGVVLGVLAGAGRDKLTIICSPELCDLGAWLEQLVAESTGKEGKAIIPVDREPLAAPDAYGDDRVFVYVRLATSPDAAQDAAVGALEHAGQPVIRIEVDEKYSLGQEFFRWEIATAVAGAVMKLNPFNQPDVQFSKSETSKLTTAYEETGSLPAEEPVFEADGVKLFADSRNASALGAAEADLAGYLRAHLGRLREGDYFAILAYIEMNQAHEEIFQEMRAAVREKTGVATCLGFGPRFLHSTGQAYKAGPNSGVFLQVTSDDARDVPVPGRKYTFGVVKAAQARGDFEVLAQRERRALRVHLGADVAAGLAVLRRAFREALG